MEYKTMNFFRRLKVILSNIIISQKTVIIKDIYQNIYYKVKIIDLLQEDKGQTIPCLDKTGTRKHIQLSHFLMSKEAWNRQ